MKYVDQQTLTDRRYLSQKSNRIEIQGLNSSFPQILNQNIINIKFQDRPTMQYLYFPSPFIPMTYIYSPLADNIYYLTYISSPNTLNIPTQKTQQPNFSKKIQSEEDFSRENVQKRDLGSEQQIQSKDMKKAIKKKRGIDKEKQLQSAKKNSQSNIINQFFSYFSCRMQSQEIVQKTILVSVDNIEELQKITSIFYNIMKCMSLQRIKKYVNKKTLLNIFSKCSIQKQIPEILQKIQSLNYVSVDQICQIIRRCCFFFIRNTSLFSILASKRISNVSKLEHLKKRRMLCHIVCGKM